MAFTFGKLMTLWRRKRALKNHTFSIISNTCIGGVMTHHVGEQFRSPTVNLVIYEHDFLYFCQHLKEYSICPLEPPTEAEAERFKTISYPVGILRGGDTLRDIAVYFVHYQTFEDAKAKWEARFKRVNYDDLFILMDRGMDATEEILDEFHALPYEHKVFFTDKEDPQRWPSTFRYDFYTPDRWVSGYLYKTRKKGMLDWLVMDEFDYVHWLNTGEIRRSRIWSRV